MSQRDLFPPRNILVPTDLGPVSKSALKYARFFHDRFGSRVYVLHAEHLKLPPYFSSGQLGDLKRELIKLIRSVQARRDVQQHNDWCNADCGRTAAGSA